jgi:tetratricopeptide (TPR) repeat protein
MLHQYGKSIETLEEALRIHRVIEMRRKGMGSSSSRDVARILENLGEVKMVSGAITSAYYCYVESLNLLRSSYDVDDESIEIALVLGAIGQVHLKRGEYAEAKVVLKECMRSFEKIGK